MYTMFLFAVQVSVGDLILRRDAVGRVAACLLEGGALLLLVDSMAVSRALAAMSDVWRMDGNRQIWRADEVEHCAAWHPEADGSVVVVRK